MTSIAGGGVTEPGGFGTPPEADKAVLDARADELFAALGRKAMQRVVDEIQRALLLGDDAKAEEHHRVLRRIMRKIYVHERAR